MRQIAGKEIDIWPDESAADVAPCSGVCGRRLPLTGPGALIKHGHQEGCTHYVCAACYSLHVISGPHLRLTNCRKPESQYELVRVPYENPFGSEPKC